MNEPDERAIIRRHSKSFALAARLLSPLARGHAEKLYAWCRYADDAIDLAPTPLDAVVALADLRAELDAIYYGRPVRSPAGNMLATVVSDIRLPREYPDELLAGMEMDAAGTRYRTLDELLLYCHRVAGVVGLMMCHAMGVADERAAVHAGHLGIAMQLTNIARDVAEDWSRGRLYLPLDWLGGEPTKDHPLDDATTAAAVLRLLQVADRYYASGEAGMIHLDRRSRLAVRVARTVYAEIGSEVRRSGCRPSAGRAVVSKARKLRAVLSAVWQGCTDHQPPRVTPPTGLWDFRPLDEWPRDTVPLPLSETIMNGSRDSMYLVTFGLALVLLMSAVLFVFVGLNPKNEDYSYLPWLYSVISAVGSVAFWVVSGRLGRIKGAPEGIANGGVKVRRAEFETAE